MARLSQELEEEIRRRVEDGRYASAEELLRLALNALDDSAHVAEVWLERELLIGLEGEDVEVMPGEFSRLRKPYLRGVSEQDSR